MAHYLKLKELLDLLSSLGLPYDKDQDTFHFLPSRYSLNVISWKLYGKPEIPFSTTYNYPFYFTNSALGGYNKDNLDKEIGATDDEFFKELEKVLLTAVTVPITIRDIPTKIGVGYRYKNNKVITEVGIGTSRKHKVVDSYDDPIVFTMTQDFVNAKTSKQKLKNMQFLDYIQDKKSSQLAKILQ